MDDNNDRWSIRERVLAVLSGEPPDRPPFVDRLLVWRNYLNKTGTMPAEYQGLSLNQVHQSVGMGRQHFMVPYALRLPEVELVADFEGEVFKREASPVVKEFPVMYGLAVMDRPGVTTVRFMTPVGEVSVQHAINASMVADCLDPYTKQHVIKGEEDFKTIDTYFIPDHVDKKKAMRIMRKMR